MARFKRIRRTFSRVKKYSRRRKSGFGSGLMGNMIAGAVVGGAISFGTPYIRQYIPSVAGMRPETIATLGVGVAAKTVLHKGGKFSDAALIIGTYMAVSDLMGSFGMGSSATASGGFID